MKGTADITLILPEPEEKLDKTIGDWIGDFRKNLNTILKRQLKRDLEFRVLVPDAKTNLDFLEVTAVTVIFMNGSFSSSKNYMKLLDALNDKLGSGKGDQVREEQVVKLLLSPDGHDLASNYLKFHSTAEFYGMKEGKGILSDAGSISYWSKLLDIGSSFEKIISEMENTEGPAAGASTLVFLANTTGDQDFIRDILRRELIQHGHRVEPEIDLRFIPGDPVKYLNTILEKAKIAVHIFGNEYGEEFAGSGTSLPEFQMQHVSEYLEKIDKEKQAQATGLIRLIWISPEITPVDDKQIEFLNQTRQNIEKLRRTEIIQAPLELFKSILLKRLRQVGEGALLVPGKTDKKVVYIIHDRRDEGEASTLREKFSAAGMEAVMIDFGRGQSNLINIHKENLVRCDAALIVYGHTNRYWLSSKMKDLLKAPGFGRRHPLAAKGVVVSGTDDLKGLQLPDDMILVKKKEALDPFIEKLKQ